MKSQICKRCIQDLSVPGIHFDLSSVCNYCHLHDLMEKEYPNDHRGEKKLTGLFKKIKTDQKNKKYCCVIRH